MIRSFFRFDFYAELVALVRRGYFSVDHARQCAVFLARATALPEALEPLLPEDRSPLILYPFWGNCPAYACALLKRRRGAKLVTRLHRYDFLESQYSPKYHPLKKAIAKRADRRLFVANEGMEYFLKRFRVKPDPERFLLRLLGSLDGGRSPENRPRSSAS
ncbi:MAG: hypothetical protein GX647_04385 [Clostridiales bacterium]|nr:hypothetical protein [Clostridiales bacterium]OQA29460.1 MAG: hypothetical protein BWY59_00297 [Verrucomicrobia bacterium ADurb.Bin345]